MVFQDPFGSLNPIHQVRHFLERAIRLHTKVGRREDLESKLEELMATVDLPADLLDSPRLRTVRRSAAAGRHRTSVGHGPRSHPGR